MTRELLQSELIRDEGVVLHAYLDSLGYLTIGVGRLIDERLGGGISEAEARFLLDHDIDRVEQALLERWPWYASLDDVRQRVLCNMAFNLGIQGLATFTKTLASIEHGDYARASTQMLQSLWAKQVKGRAVRLARMMRNGTDGQA